MIRPAANEYAQSYQGYISKVAGTDVLGALVNQHKLVLEILASLDDEKAKYAYDTGKWSIKELIGHIIDCERVFSYRAVSIARGEQQPLPGFEQDGFVLHAKFNNRSLESLKDEYNHLRLANIALIKSLTEEDISRKGTASNNPVTVRALLFIIAGHEKHHLDILKERYLGNIQQSV
jgi:uncharacterized damage-inducible protein DinB